MQMVPAGSRGRVFNTSVGINSDIFSTDLVPGCPGESRSSVYRLTVCLDTASKLRLHVDNGTTEVSGEFNSGSNLTANSVYTFVHEVRNGDSVNYQLGSSAVTIKFMYVSEVFGETI